MKSIHLYDIWRNISDKTIMVVEVNKKLNKKLEVVFVDSNNRFLSSLSIECFFASQTRVDMGDRGSPLYIEHSP